MKIVKGPPGSGQDHGRRASLKAVLREKHLAPYLHLSCGHITTREEQEAYAIWKPKRGLYRCPEHSKWVTLEPKKPLPPLPEEPPF